MGQIKTTKGLNVPIEGQPAGEVSSLVGSGKAAPFAPDRIALNLKPFDDVKFKLLAKVGDTVKIGQPLAEDKSCPGRNFCAPAAGVIREERRGLKRVLLDIVIDVAKEEAAHQWPKIDVDHASKEQILQRLLEGGIFAKIRVRPFNLLADPTKPPRAIFVKAIESAPLVPKAEMQVAGHEEEFRMGLHALSKLTAGDVHLVYSNRSTFQPFVDAQHVKKHTAEGPHPIGTHSVHIQYIDPIRSVDDVVWTLTAHDVVAMGHLLMHGTYYINRVISIAGPGVLNERAAYVKAREGLAVSILVSGRLRGDCDLRFISGDPLIGQQVHAEDYLGFYDYALSVIPEGSEREFLHFFRLGINKYTCSKAYVAGHFDWTHRKYAFTTSQHGEHRAFVDATLYDQVMPLPIATMSLLKAVMAEDYELAEKLGLLSVDSEDFALTSFVCPSKIEMIDIMKKGLKQYAHDILTG